MNNQKTGSGKCPVTGQSQSTQTTDAFTTLYDTFTGGDPDYDQDVYESSNAIAVAIENQAINQSPFDDMLVIGGQHMVLYHSTNDKKSFQFDDYQVIRFRSTDPSSTVSTGFTAITSMSHLLPTLAYFGQALSNIKKVNGDETRIQGLITKFKEDISGVKYYLNAADGWFKQASLAAVYTENEADIKKVGNWILDKANAFLEAKYVEDNYSFTVEDVRDYFLPAASQETYLATCSVLTSTFCVVLMEVAYNLYNKYKDTVLSKVDWANVKVVISGQSGSLASGVNVTTNSTLKLVNFFAELVSGAPINPKNIFIEPFVDLPETVKDTYNGWGDKVSTESPNGKLTSEEAEAYLYSFNAHWLNLKNRVDISETLFNKLYYPKDKASQSFDIADRIEKMYESTPSIESMIPFDLPATGTYTPDVYFTTARVAFTMVDYRDTISDSVTAYILDIWKNQQYPAEKDFTIPGMDYPFESL